MIKKWSKRKKVIVGILIFIVAFFVIRELPLKTASETRFGNTITVKYPIKFNNSTSGIWLKAGNLTCWDNSSFFTVDIYGESAAIYSTSFEEYFKKRKDGIGLPYKSYSEVRTRVIDGKQYYEYDASIAENQLQTFLVGFNDGYIVIMKYDTKGYCPNEQFNVERYYEQITNSIKHS